MPLCDFLGVYLTLKARSHCSDNVIFASLSLSLSFSLSLQWDRALTLTLQCYSTPKLLDSDYGGMPDTMSDLLGVYLTLTLTLQCYSTPKLLDSDYGGMPDTMSDLLPSATNGQFTQFFSFLCLYVYLFLKPLYTFGTKKEKKSSQIYK